MPAVGGYTWEIQGLGTHMFAVGSSGVTAVPRRWVNRRRQLELDGKSCLVYTLKGSRASIPSLREEA